MNASSNATTTQLPVREKDTFIIRWMIITHLLALGAIFTFSWSGLAVFCVMYFVTACLGITMGMHRYFTHRSFKTKKWFERFLAICGTLALQGSVLEWVGHHRMHHAGSDTPKDPHDASRGFWFSHIGWMFYVAPEFDDDSRLRRFARDIAADPFLMWLSKSSVMIGMQVALGLIFFAIGGLSWVFWGIFLRVVCVYHATWLVNSAAHMWGYKNYEVGDLATNNWFVALVTFGEGWHNNHHAYDSVAQAGHKWWEFDVTLMTLKLLRALGIVSHMKMMPKEVELTPPETVGAELVN